MATKLIRERGRNTFTNYLLKGFGLTIDSITVDLAGFMIGWHLHSDDDDIQGHTVEGFLDALKALITKYDIKIQSKNKTDRILIYTDNIEKVAGFFYNNLTDIFPKEDDKNILYVQLLNLVEVRSMEPWNDDLHTAEEISEYADYLIKEFFVPRKYFYLTPNQVARKKIDKAGEVSVCKEIAPDTYTEYTYLKKALFGGLMYSMYDDKYSENPYLAINEPMLALDIVSAYIYCFCMKKHAVSKSRIVDPNTWEFYTASQNKLSLGTYRIKYSSPRSYIKCFKDINGEQCKMGLHESLFIFTNVDLRNFQKLAQVFEIECLELREYDAGYIPKSLLGVILSFYTTKQELKPMKKENPRAYQLSKIELNGIYGDTIRRLDDRDAWKDYYKHAVLAPQWGIWITSYCKEMIIELGLQLEGWIQSNTDSIKCLDTKNNRKMLEEMNIKIRENIKDFCDNFGYDYESLKDLGTFDIEDEIVRFHLFHANTYIYQNKDGEMTIKAAGCDTKKLPLNEELFNLNKVPAGEKIERHIATYPSELKLKNITLKNDCSYFEIKAKDDEAIDLMKIRCFMNNKAN